MLRVYYADCRSLPAEPGSLPLSAYRREKLGRQRAELSRKEGIGGELLLIHALRGRGSGCKLPLQISVTRMGKPYLDERGLFFSLSHSDGMALLALSDREVGADLQKLSRFKDPVARRAFTAEERELLQSASDPDRAFTRLWARKESFLKALGCGLSGLNGAEPEGNPFWEAWHDDWALSVCVPGLDQPRPDAFERVDWDPCLSAFLSGGQI